MADVFEGIRNAYSEWKQKDNLYMYHLRQVFGNEYYLYFVNSVTFIRNNLNLPLSMTSNVFDVRQSDAENKLREFLHQFDEAFRTHVDNKLSEFPHGVNEY